MSVSGDYLLRAGGGATLCNLAGKKPSLQELPARRLPGADGNPDQVLDVVSARFSADGRKLAVLRSGTTFNGGKLPTVEILETATLAPLGEFEVPEEPRERTNPSFTNEPWMVRFHPDGESVLVANTQAFLHYSPQGKRLGRIPARRSTLNASATLLAALDDGTVQVHDLATDTQGKKALAHWVDLETGSRIEPQPLPGDLLHSDVARVRCRALWGLGRVGASTTWSACRARFVPTPTRRTAGGPRRP